MSLQMISTCSSEFSSSLSCVSIAIFFPDDLRESEVDLLSICKCIFRCKRNWLRCSLTLPHLLHVIVWFFRCSSISVNGSVFQHIMQRFFFTLSCVAFLFLHIDDSLTYFILDLFLGLCFVAEVSLVDSGDLVPFVLGLKQSTIRMKGEMKCINKKKKHRLQILLEIYL